MSDQDESDDFIKNDDTRQRRAWVGRAITGVRRRLRNGEELATAAIPPESSEVDGRPSLTVVNPRRKR